MAGADRPDVTAIPLGRPSPGASSNQPEQPGQRIKAPPRPRAKRVAPIRFCSRRGLPCRRRCRPRGALLPHPFTLADGFKPCGPPSGGLLSVALSLGSPPPDVIRRRIRMEPGLSSAISGGRPADWPRRDRPGPGAGQEQSRRQGSQSPSGRRDDLDRLARARARSARSWAPLLQRGGRPTIPLSRPCGRR